MGNADVVGHLHRRLIAFDLDGTLIDSRQDLADSANELIEALGGRPLPTEAVASMVGEGAAVLVRRALSAAGVEDTPAAVPRFLSIYDRRLLVHTRLYPGIEEVLLYARTVASVAVLTNKPLAPTLRILEGLQVRHLIEHVVGGDGPYPRKPDPAGLRALMTITASTPGRTLLIGDSDIDRTTARQAGAATCLVTYGFGRPESVAERPEWLAASPAHISEAIGRFGDTSA